MEKLSPLASATWISSPLVGGPRTTSPSPYFRKSFLLKSRPKSARLQVTALGFFECEINGRRIGDEVFAPGWTDYHKTLYFETYEVTDFLQLGENVIGALLGDGWYCGYIAWKNRQNYGDRPHLLLALEVECEDGTSITVTTEESWRTSTGPILESDMLMGEAYDARLELGTWSSPGYDESAWAFSCKNSPKVLPKLLPRTGPPVRRIEEITPVNLTVTPYWTGPIRIYDLGQNFSGRVRLRVRAARGRTIRIRHAEMTNPDDSIYTANLREARADDSYVCRGVEEEIWEPRFTFHGFRYVEVTGLKETDSFDLTGIVLHSDMALTGAFSCSNPLLNQLQSNILWSQKSNFLEVPTDCPQRNERMGWTGDAQVFVRTACFNMNVRDFFRKWMRDMRDGQQTSGGVPCVIPTLEIQEIFDEDGGPGWSDAMIVCPWTIYLCYGDREILSENYEAMQRYFNFLVRERCVGWIRSHPDVSGWLGYGDWLALDGEETAFGSTPKDLIGTAYLAQNAEILTAIAKLLGDEVGAQKFAAQRREIGEAYTQRFVSASGRLSSETQTAAILTLQFGLAEGAVRDRIARDLVEKIEANGYRLATGFLGTPFLLNVLEENGYLDIAYRLLEQESFPSWLFPVKNGATTIWERWDAWTEANGFHGDGMNSFNHYAYGAVGAWMYRSLAGLDLDSREPGYRKIIFRPRPGGSLTWAQASLMTTSGKASIRWELAGDELRLDLVVPPGSVATLDLPLDYEVSPEPVLLEPGRHAITARKMWHASYSEKSLGSVILNQPKSATI